MNREEYKQKQKEMTEKFKQQQAQVALEMHEVMNKLQ